MSHGPWLLLYIYYEVGSDSKLCSLNRITVKITYPYINGNSQIVDSGSHRGNTQW